MFRLPVLSALRDPEHDHHGCWTPNNLVHDFYINLNRQTPCLKSFPIHVFPDVFKNFIKSVQGRNKGTL